jgi:hypothetical protein
VNEYKIVGAMAGYAENPNGFSMFVPGVHHGLRNLRMGYGLLTAETGPSKKLDI